MKLNLLSSLAPFLFFSLTKLAVSLNGLNLAVTSKFYLFTTAITKEN